MEMMQIVYAFLGCLAFGVFCAVCAFVWIQIDVYRQKQRRCSVGTSLPSLTGQFLVDKGISRNARDRPKILGIDGVERDLVVLLEMYGSSWVRMSKEEISVE